MTDRLRIEYVPLGELKRYPRNPKDHDLGLLGLSVGRFGFTEPILIDESSGTVVAGHGRIDTLEQKYLDGEHPPRGIEECDDEEDGWMVPVVRGVAFRDENEMRAYVIASNKTVEAGGWHDELLLDELKALAEAEIPLEGTGFDLDDLDQMIADADFASHMADAVPLPPEKDASESKLAVAYGVIVKLGDKSAEDDLIALLEGYDYLARRLSDPVGKFYAIPQVAKSPAHDPTGSVEDGEDAPDDL